MRKKLQTLKNLSKIQDNNILRTISLSQETIRYPSFKPEIASQAHKDPYTWNKKNFQKFNFIQILLKLEEKMLMTISLPLEIM